jgi:IS5 family transposase
MFKILVLQALYSLSDGAAEFQIKDRLSFQRFLGLGLDGVVPDATTVWLFRERLVKARAIERLFSRFDAVLKERGYLAMGGQIIDATVVPAPKQRNTLEEKAVIKEGRTPADWSPAKARQKDRDARWSIKYTKAKVPEGADPKAPKPVDLAIPMFGYKNHIGIDKAHGLIRAWVASAANAHDGAWLPDLVRKDNTASGRLGGHSLSLEEERGLPGQGHVRQQHPPETPAQAGSARAGRASQCPTVQGSRSCSFAELRFEHVFAGQKHRMGLIVRTIGTARATIKIGMANLVYNFQRMAWLEGRVAPA